MANITLEKSLEEICEILFDKYEIFKIMFNNGKEISDDLINNTQIIGFENGYRKNKQMLLCGEDEEEQIYKVGDFTVNQIFKYYDNQIKNITKKVLDEAFEEINKEFDRLKKIYDIDLKKMYIVSKNFIGADFYHKLIEIENENKIDISQDIKHYKKSFIEVLNDEELVKNHIKFFLEQNEEKSILTKDEILKEIENILNKNFEEIGVKNPNLKNDIQEEIFEDIQYNIFFKIPQNDSYYVDIKNLKNFNFIESTLNIFKIYNEDFLNTKRKLKKNIIKLIDSIKNKKTKKYQLLLKLNDELDDNTNKEDFEYIKEVFKTKFEKDILKTEEKTHYKLTELKTKYNNIFNDNININLVCDEVNKYLDDKLGLSEEEIEIIFENFAFEEFNRYIEKIQNLFNQSKEKIDTRKKYIDYENIRKKIKEFNKEDKTKEEIIKRDNKLYEIIDFFNKDFDIIKQFRTEEENEHYQEFNKELKKFLKTELDIQKF